ncbi:hypothetical protein QBC41DRAFT_326710 [Cercophora samala]|uniref:Uncharacterized protein n=1 Tax=Cercophora samala TaxID=330535 RepID=A0AA39Z857_9PEZI|nr:hypothetical protein QBC41DRAFT_326710 [Cercophora samala]
MGQSIVRCHGVDLTLFVLTLISTKSCFSFFPSRIWHTAAQRNLITSGVWVNTGTASPFLFSYFLTKFCFWFIDKWGDVCVCVCVVGLSTVCQRKRSECILNKQRRVRGVRGLRGRDDEWCGNQRGVLIDADGAFHGV